MRFALVLSFLSLFSSVAFSAAPKVAQSFYVIGSPGFDPETGERIGLFGLKTARANSYRVSDIQFHPLNANTVVLTSYNSQNFELRLVIEFQAFDSAKVFKNLLVNGGESLELVTKSNSPAHFSIYTDAANVYVSRGSDLMPIGEIIGPLRSYDDQGFWTKRWIDIFGRGSLKSVNFDGAATEPRSEQNL